MREQFTPQHRVPGSPPLSTRRSASPEPPSTPSERASIKAPSLKSRARVCVCAASMQLGRERSRLVKVEQSVNQKMQRLAEREEAVDSLDAQVSAQEQELDARRADFRLEEAAVTGKIEVAEEGQADAKLRGEVAGARDSQVQQRRRHLLRQQQRLTKRLERVAGNRQQLGEDGEDVTALQAELEEERAALVEAESSCASSDANLTQLREELGRVSAEVGDLRAVVRARQGDLEVIQGDLQTKEADLDERRALLERTSAELIEREERLVRTRAEASDDAQRRAEVQRESEELERQLARLWDDIHQRRQMLEDVDTCLLGREERLMSAQHSLVVAREAGAASGGRGQWGAPADVDVEQLKLELMAAELSERAWRERSAALAGRQEELTARIQCLEAARSEAAALPVAGKKLGLAH